MAELTLVQILGLVITVGALFVIATTFNRPSATKTKSTKAKKAGPGAGASTTATSGGTESKSNKKKKSKKAKKPEEPVKEMKEAKEAEKPVVSAKAAPPAPVPVASPAPAVTETATSIGTDPIETGSSSSGGKSSKKSKETPEQRAARLERQKVRKAAKEAEERSAAFNAAGGPEDSSLAVPAEQPGFEPAADAADGWEVVGQKAMNKKKVKAASVALAAAKEEKAAVDDAAVVEAAVPVEEVFKSEVTVEFRKLGAIIGPKGATLKALREAGSVDIQVPRRDENDKPPEPSSMATVELSGSHDGMKKVAKAINEISTKGYCRLLAGDDFIEANVAATSRCCAELMSGSGKGIRAIQDACNVRIHVPPAPAKLKAGEISAASGNSSSSKLGIAGPVAGVMRAKSIIKEIMEFKHSEVTHPGVVHRAVPVPPHLFSIIIGPKGSEIKHIRSNFKVNVHIPDNEVGAQPPAEAPGVLVIGPQTAVDSASRYIEKIVDQATQAAAAAESKVSEDWAQEEPAPAHESWMDQYDYSKRVSLDPAPTPAAAASSGAEEAVGEKAAWGVTSAEGW
jgi:rRNA processing protein Krr1/Pno1